MSGIIKTLKNKINDIEKNVYPKTVLEAVIDPETGKTLDVLLDENMPEGVVYTNDESEPETNVDAVTSASYVSYSNTDSGLEAINVQDAVDEIKESVGEYIAENLIAYPYFNTTSTVDGVTFTDNGDGTITANGTATGSFSSFTCRLCNEGHLGYQLILPKGTYTLSGCPDGGSGGTYFLQVGRTNPNTGTWQTIATDIGEGATFTITEEMQVSVTIAVIGGTTVNNLVFKPMLEVGTVAHEYKPYTSTKLTKGDIVDNLLTGRADLPLSAKQGVVLKDEITPNHISADDVYIRNEVSNTNLRFWAIEYKEYVLVSIVLKLNNTINTDGWTTIISGLPNATRITPLNVFNSVTQTRDVNALYMNDSIVLVTQQGLNYVEAGEDLYISGIAVK